MYKIQAQQDNNSEIEIFIYSVIDPYNIDGYTISAKKIIDTLKTHNDLTRINIRINSEGGEVFEAFSMYNYLKQHKAEKHVYIDGIAASGASIVAMAGDKIYMPANSMMMIHNPLTVAYGNADDMREQADILDKIADSMISIYSEKTGLNPEKIKELADAESYLNAKECKDLGLCDIIIESVQNKNQDKINALLDDAVKSERKRIQELDELMTPSRKSIIDEAKFITGKSAHDIALDLLRAENKEGHLFDRNLDTKDFEGMNFQNMAMPDKNDELISNMAAKINTQRGYK